MRFPQAWKLTRLLYSGRDLYDTALFHRKLVDICIQYLDKINAKFTVVPSYIRQVVLLWSIFSHHAYVCTEIWITCEATEALSLTFAKAQSFQCTQ